MLILMICWAFESRTDCQPARPRGVSQHVDPAECPDTPGWGACVAKSGSGPGKEQSQGRGPSHSITDYLAIV